MPPSNLTRSVLWMVGALLSFSLMAVSIRELASHGLSIVSILGIRAGGALVVLSALLVARPELLAYVRPRRPWLHLLRNGIHFASQMAWATGLTILPLAMVFALEFTMPAWTILLAPLMLRERLSASRIGVVVLGLAGVLVILRPGIASVNPAAFLVLIAALGYALTNITTKMLTATETTFGIIFSMMAIQLPLALALTDLSVYRLMTVADIAPALCVVAGGLFSHYCMTNAFRAGDAMVVVPLDFLRIPLIAVVGWVLYREALDIFVLIGAVIIIAGVMWNLRAESAARR